MTDSDKINISEQIDWMNDCGEIAELAVSAKVAVQKENFEKAHEKLNELRNRVESVSEEYPRYIHQTANAGQPD